MQGASQSPRAMPTLTPLSAAQQAAVHADAYAGDACRQQFVRLHEAACRYRASPSRMLRGHVMSGPYALWTCPSRAAPSTRSFGVSPRELRVLRRVAPHWQYVSCTMQGHEDLRRALNKAVAGLSRLSWACVPVPHADGGLRGLYIPFAASYGAATATVAFRLHYAAGGVRTPSPGARRLPCFARTPPRVRRPQVRRPAPRKRPTSPAAVALNKRART